MDAAGSGRPPEGQPRARLIDLTRLVSRVGLRPTGIDRVERQYLEYFLADPVPLFALVRTTGGVGRWKRPVFSLFDREGTAALADRLRGIAPFGNPDFAALIRRKARPAQRAAYADLRRLRAGQSEANGLADLFHRFLPEGTAWISCSHLNMDHDAVFRAISARPGGRSSVVIHDTIPLDFPTLTASHATAGFRKTLRNVSAHADLVICNSGDTQGSAQRHLAAFGRVPPMIVAHLGVAPASPDPRNLPRGLDTAKPYFVTVGTIEPRKNHALLLDIWEHFAATMPDEQIPNLLIIGKRGWLNEDVFARLDSSPLMGRHVHEFPDLDDGTVAALVAGARALLMPSLAEGFGLPPAEALALGTPALVNDLPVYREALGNNPVYAPVSDMYSWAEKILEFARADRTERKAATGAAKSLPTWQEHFNLVLKVT